RRIYEKNVSRMAELFRIKPEKAVCDLHPAYFTTGFAEKYAEEAGIELIRVQHHHAHVASVMAEHDIKGPVIGVSFDGTGYGTDGAVWGGEFLLCEGSGFERKAHLKYVTMTGGDSTVREGWKSAFSYRHAIDSGSYKKESEKEIIVDISDIIEFAEKNGTLKPYEAAAATAKKAIDMGINTIRSSSMGRLFDGVAAALGICAENTYEGQCAIMLEDAAARAAKGGSLGEADDLALAFHRRIAKMILENCLRIHDETGAWDVALTGGVFQNKLLMEDTLELLRKHHLRPYYNISVSPNDGGIALGQAFAAMNG
ncbi:MAG: carbamoyltransferase HypF, partial [Firmicutes bacterium]|nr:carbamoyltransferase HypF [Bacillota bacterium]